MPPAKKKSTKSPTVFFGRETPVRREDVPNLSRSIENEFEYDDLRVVSDIPDNDSGDESEKTASESPLPQEKTVPSLKRARPSPPPDDEMSPAPVSTPAKRQRRADKTKDDTPRRSTRISVAPNVQEEEPAPIMPKKRGRGRPPKKPESRGSQKEWEIEKIVDSQVDAITKEHFYRVKWKGFPSTDNTWEPRKNLAGCNRAIQAFEKGIKK